MLMWSEIPRIIHLTVVIYVVKVFPQVGFWRLPLNVMNVSAGQSMHDITNFH